MDLQGGNIKVSQLLQNPQARAILNREFPGVINSPMVRMAQGMSLNRVISHVRGKIPQSTINRVLKELKEL